jgi:hypothetical protein
MLRRAKEEARQLCHSYTFWYRRKFNLPPNDPRFLDLTLEEIEVEFWAHHYAEVKESGDEELEDDDFEESLQEFLGGKNGESGDAEDFDDIINETYGE